LKAKLKKRVLRNGPDPSNEEELVCAAWLIKNGYADGRVQRDYTKSTNIPAALDWQGITGEGDQYLSQSLLYNPYTVSIVSALAVALILWLLA
jgi:hypothetical protein